MAVLTIAAGYAAYKIYAIHAFYRDLGTPKAEFTVKSGNQPRLTIVEFLNYDCGPCKDTHRVLLNYADANPDIRLVVRPVPYANDQAETATERALAAGLQGKFWDMDRALVEYKGELDEKFYRESAALYDIDYQRMVLEAEGETVQDYAGDNAKASLRAGIETVPALMVGKTLYKPDGPLTLPDLIRMVRKEQE